MIDSMITSKAAAAVIGPTFSASQIKSEAKLYFDNPPKARCADVGAFTGDGYRKFWAHMSHPYTALSKLVLACCDLLPSEASCERLFSVVKFVVGDRRYNASSANVDAAVCVRMMMQSATKLEVTRDMSTEFYGNADAAEQMREQEDVDPRYISVEACVLLANVFVGAETNRAPDRVCNHCGTQLFLRAGRLGKSEHASIVQCVSCKKQWGVGCYNEKFGTKPETPGRWMAIHPSIWMDGWDGWMDGSKFCADVSNGFFPF